MFLSGAIVPNSVQKIYEVVASGFSTGIYQLAVASLLKPVQQQIDFSLHQVADVQHVLSSWWPQKWFMCNTSNNFK